MSPRAVKPRGGLSAKLPSSSFGDCWAALKTAGLPFPHRVKAIRDENWMTLSDQYFCFDRGSRHEPLRSSRSIASIVEVRLGGAVLVSFTTDFGWSVVYWVSGRIDYGGQIASVRLACCKWWPGHDRFSPKQDWIPPFADKPVFVIAPAIVMVCTLRASLSFRWRQV